jgi:NitT/TauT family transport system ATP-binding protein
MGNSVKIRIENLSKSFLLQEGRELEVLKGINANVLDNEFVLVIGPSGCGKTTLLSIIAGFEPATSGKVYIDERTIERPGRERGVVFQETALFPWRKVLRNVEYGMEMRGMNKEERKKRAMKYLEMTNLQDFVNAYPKELSGGMKKRLSLATVYANDPEVLLMDEPFSALDYPTKIKLQMDLLDLWSKEKKTTIFVSHDVEEALILADRILVLKGGHITLEYKNPFERPRKDSLRDDFAFLKEEHYLKECYLEDKVV